MAKVIIKNEEILKSMENIGEILKSTEKMKTRLKIMHELNIEPMKKDFETFGSTVVQTISGNIFENMDKKFQNLSGNLDEKFQMVSNGIQNLKSQIDFLVEQNRIQNQILQNLVEQRLEQNILKQKMDAPKLLLDLTDSDSIFVKNLDLIQLPEWNDYFPEQCFDDVQVKKEKKEEKKVKKPHGKKTRKTKIDLFLSEKPIEDLKICRRIKKKPLRYLNEFQK